MIREQEFQSKGTVWNDIMKLFVGVRITILGVGGVYVVNTIEDGNPKITSCWSIMISMEIWICKII